MAAIKVTTRAPKKDKELEVEYDFGASLDEAKEKFGDEVIFSNFKQSAVISLQGIVRRHLDKGELTDEQIREKVAAWKPGVAIVKTSDKKAIVLAAFGKMSEEEKKALLEQLLAG